MVRIGGTPAVTTKKNRSTFHPSLPELVRHLQKCRTLLKIRELFIKVKTISSN